MRTFFPSLFRGGRAALLLVAATCLTPERASAGCGDHVIILDDSKTSDRAAADSSRPPKPPCEGPNCSGAPLRDPAPLAPAASGGPQAKELAETLLPAAGAGEGRSTFGRDFSSPRPVRRPSSVFHPPRIG